MSMRILLVHNRYLQPGGEDAVVEAERRLLESRGHQVIFFQEANTRLLRMHPLRAAQHALWSRETQQKLQRVIEATRPDIAHFHNTFLLVSPAAYYTCQALGVPVVQTLHNYRLLCPNALLLRQGRACVECVGRRVPWPALVYGCWRGSRSQTGVVVAMLTLHRLLGTWQRQVDVYIALTQFARRLFLQGGLPERKVVVKPPFLHPDPGPGTHHKPYALFVGRLAVEKGVETLLQAWKRLPRIPLVIIGDGPMRAWARQFVDRNHLGHVHLMGRRPRAAVLQWMQDARLLVFPSLGFEGFPMTLVEAMATGLPVVASRLGAMAEIVKPGRTGLLFDPGNAEALAAQVAWAWKHPQALREMGMEARHTFEAQYTAERNYPMLLQIYRRALDGG